MLKISFLSVVYLLYHYSNLLLQVAGEVCPDKIGPFRRVGKTKFYVSHDPPRGDFVDYEEAKALCDANGLWMARIRDMQTMAVVGRTLEQTVEKEGLMDTWYWLGAHFDEAKEQYMWTRRGNETADTVVRYSVLLYRPFRPAGLASFVNYMGEYLINNDEVKQCLTIALPYPGKGDPNRRGITYGHNTILDERPCIGKQKRHAMCEINKTACESREKDPFVLTEDKIAYFEDGHWILGQRKYIISWKHRTFSESEKHCKSLGLNVVDPGMVEKDLIPYLKMWSRNVTISQFWTAIRFDAKSKMFVDSAGTEIDGGKQTIRIEWKEKLHSITTRSNKHDPEFCVALSFSYEFKNQMACEQPNSESCSWSFLDYVPANCNNYLGLICQHPNANFQNEKLHWDPEYIPTHVNKALIDTAVTADFGYKGNTHVVRSTYKQTFGSFVCPKGYQMVRENSVSWAEKPNAPAESMYMYDYKDTYWVVDSGGFYKTADSECTVSMPILFDGEGHTRQPVRVKCTSWHFYLCETSRRPIKRKQYNTPVPPTMVWSDRRQPRIYPLVKF